MNRKKLNIIKKTLGVHNWTLGGDNFPDFINVFDGNGRIIMEYNEKTGKLFYNSKNLCRKVKVFFVNIRKAEQLMKMVLKDRFGWRRVRPDDLPFN